MVAQFTTKKGDFLVRKNKKKSVTKLKDEHRPFDFTLFMTVMILLGMGIVMVLSASSPSALAMTGSSYTFVSRQAMAAVLGLGLMFFISKIDYKKYMRFYKVIYGVSVGALLLVLVPFLRKRDKWSA